MRIWTARGEDGTLFLTDKPYQTRTLRPMRSRSSASSRNGTEEEPEPIGLIEAVFLPGVLAVANCIGYHFLSSQFQYCLCNACLKLVNYAFFFWLPLYLTEAYHWEESRVEYS